MFFKNLYSSEIKGSFNFIDKFFFKESTKMKLFWNGHPEVISGVPFETMSSSDWRLNDQELASAVFIDVERSTVLNRNLNFVFEHLF
jgi:hypothetical protein